MKLVLNQAGKALMLSVKSLTDKDEKGRRRKMDFEKKFESYEKELRKLIKEKFPNGQEYYFDPDEKLSKNQLKEAIKLKNDFGFSLLDAIKEILEENDVFLEQQFEMKKNIKEIVVEYLSDKLGKEYVENLNEDEENIIDEFSYDSIEDVLSNESVKRLASNIAEINVKIFPEEYVEDSFYQMQKYQSFKYYGGGEIYPGGFTAKELEEISDELRNPENPDMINWLCQTQGYEIYDLYDDKKVEQSEFLTSLKEELCSYDTVLESKVLTICCLGADFDSLEAATDEKNLAISPEKNFLLGLFDGVNGSGCGMNIKLEKELVVPSEWKHVDFFVSKYDKGDYYSLSDVFDFSSSRTDSDVFRSTDKPSVKAKPIDLERLRRIAREFERQDREESHKRR